MKTLKDRWGENLSIDGSSGNAYIEWGCGQLQPMIVWNEWMQFHCSLEARCEDDELTAIEVRDRIEDPSSGFIAHTERELKRMLPAGFEATVEWSEWDDQDEFPFIQLMVWRAEDMSPDTTEEDAFNLLWPAIATLFNITDPGTFNSPYLFTTMPYRKGI